MISLRALADRDGRFCRYCWEEFDHQLHNATRDHVIPRSRGGSNASENIVLSCGWCNERKGDMDVEEFFEILPGLLEAKRRSSLFCPPVPPTTPAKMSGAGNCRGMYAAERFPTAEASGHIRGWDCICRPTIMSIKGGWHVLTHHEIQFASRGRRSVVQ